MVFVNYKSVNHKSVTSAPDLEELLEDLYVNTTICFPGEETEDEFVARIVGYLHADVEASSRSLGNSSRSPQAKRTKRGLVVRGVKFRNRSSPWLHLETLKKRWELFVILAEKHGSVAASCLVHFNDIYKTCEIHEVCVADQGRGLCKRLLTNVRDFILRGHSGDVKEIRIFCEKSNPAAYKCYSSVFPSAQVIASHMTTAFVTRI
jgi:hypothetical protein